MKKLAIYIHWPFCLSKCPYCDFSSRRLPPEEDEAQWAHAYGRELEGSAQKLSGRTITSVYFGGGTPSLMQAKTVGSIIDKIVALWPVAENCEITLEANPTSSEIEKFKAFRGAGVGRLSLGVQSFDNDALRFLGRTHDAASACRAIDMAANVFERFSFDLIYARAGQTPQMWAKELARAFSFSPKHLSLYQLTIEPRSAFYRRAAHETLTANEAFAAEMFDVTQEMAEKANLPAYEISNHAEEGQESRHNLTYWHYENYIGIGPAAHSRFCDKEGQRWAQENHDVPAQWLAQGSGAAQSEKIDMQTAMKEALMMGLRLSSGIDKAAWHRKFGKPLEDFLLQDRLEAAQEEGLLMCSKEKFSATPEGRKKLNALLVYLLK